MPRATSALDLVYAAEPSDELREACQRHHVSPETARLVVIVLATLTNGRNQAWPSVGYLARVCWLDERRVRRALAALQDAGLVSLNGRQGRFLVRSITIAESPR